jgi:LPXTG-site transpeptidase (sortase) family protein
MLYLRKINTKQNIRKIINILSLAVFLLAVYIIFIPLIPEISFWFSKTFFPANLYKYESYLTYSDNISNNGLLQIPDENTLIIPAIGVNGTINEGETSKTLDKGLWRKPNGSSPDKGGNTVIVAHRYKGGDTLNSFYNLPKLNIRDRMVIFWDHKELVYEVYEVREVLPTAIEVEDNTADPILTLITCTPLWTHQKRLVVRARLIIPIDSTI